MLLLTISGEVFVKGSWTRRSFGRRVEANLRLGLHDVAGVRVYRLWWNRLVVEAVDLDAAAAVAARTFGVQRVDVVDRFTFTDLEDLAAQIGARSRDRVAGRTYAVRLKRRGSHAWNSMDAMRVIGAVLYDGSAGVDLTGPEVEVRIEVADEVAYLVERSWPGPDGLPLGTQERALALLSGGFDSPVAAWMMMRRGCPVDLIHFKLDCAQSDHAAAVGLELWKRWSHGEGTTLHVVDFQPVKGALQAVVEPRVRQVVLKQLMVEAAGRLAGALAIPALVTGEAVGQVSSQTLVHLVAIDRATDVPILRPLLGMTKQEIIGLARRVGTHDLSARAREVCDLSGGGPVAVAAAEGELAEAHRQLPDDLLAAALARREAIDIADWRPGLPIPQVAAG